jgi:hypothetical protein
VITQFGPITLSLPTETGPATMAPARIQHPSPITGISLPKESRFQKLPPRVTC